MVSNREDLSGVTLGETRDSSERQSDAVYEFSMEKTVEGGDIVLSGRVPVHSPQIGGASAHAAVIRFLDAFSGYLERFPKGRIEVKLTLNSGEPQIMQADVRPTTDSSSVELGKAVHLPPTARFEHEEQSIDSDDLIPVAPPRPSRTRKVRLINRGKDRPQPAEDPWA